MRQSVNLSEVLTKVSTVTLLRGSLSQGFVFFFFFNSESLFTLREAENMMHFFLTEKFLTSFYFL